MAYSKDIPEMSLVLSNHTFPTIQFDDEQNITLVQRTGFEFLQLYPDMVYQALEASSSVPRAQLINNLKPSLYNLPIYIFQVHQALWTIRLDKVDTSLLLAILYSVFLIQAAQYSLIIPFYRKIRTKCQTVLRLFGCLNKEKLAHLNKLYAEAEYSFENSFLKSAAPSSARAQNHNSRTPTKKSAHQSLASGKPPESKRRHISQVTNLSLLRLHYFVVLALCFAVQSFYPIVNYFVTTKLQSDYKRNSNYFADITAERGGQPARSVGPSRWRFIVPIWLACVVQGTFRIEKQVLNVCRDSTSSRSPSLPTS